MPTLTQEETYLPDHPMTPGSVQPVVPGREAVCPDCWLVYWIAGGHECDRRPKTA